MHEVGGPPRVFDSSGFRIPAASRAASVRAYVVEQSGTYWNAREVWWVRELADATLYASPEHAGAVAEAVGGGRPARALAVGIAEK